MNNRREILQYIANQAIPKINDSTRNQPIVLFLDIDGTLAEFNNDPEQCFIATDILNDIEKLHQFCSVYLVTGRSIQQAQKLIQSYLWNIAGSHGLELRYQNLTQPLNQDVQSINALKAFALQHAVNWQPIYTEIKTYSVAWHFRSCPEYADQAQKIAEDCLAQFTDFEIKAGKSVFELIPQGVNKGTAIHNIFYHLENAAPYPIFIGDDLTDEAGFKAIQHIGGLSIKVGEGESTAIARLKDVADVGFFLNEFLTALEALKQDMKGENTCRNSLSYPIA